jgi:diketogulonate reductase-like aldo/keto reductase
VPYVPYVPSFAGAGRPGSAHEAALAPYTPPTAQVEMHPFLRQDELMQFCHQHDVVVIAYSPLGSPGSDFGGPPVALSWVLVEARPTLALLMRACTP